MRGKGGFGGTNKIFLNKGVVPNNFFLQLVSHNKDVALLALTFWAQRVQGEQYAAILIWESRVGKLDFTKIMEWDTLADSCLS